MMSPDDAPASRGVKGKHGLPALKAKAHSGKENQDTQTRLQKLSARLLPDAEQHGACSIVCLRAHRVDAGTTTLLAAMSVDSLIRILNGQSFRVLHMLSGFVSRGPNACIKCAWSADGQLIAAGSENGLLHVWRLPMAVGSSLLAPKRGLNATEPAPQACNVIQPAYQGKGECVGVSWNPAMRELAVCCLGSAAPVHVLAYSAMAGDMLAPENSCDVVVDVLEVPPSVPLPPLPPSLPPSLPSSLPLSPPRPLHLIDTPMHNTCHHTFSSPSLPFRPRTHKRTRLVNRVPPPRPSLMTV
jgi:hypothetical protein